MTDVKTEAQRADRLRWSSDHREAVTSVGHAALTTSGALDRPAAGKFLSRPELLPALEGLSASSPVGRSPVSTCLLPFGLGSSLHLGHLQRVTLCRPSSQHTPGTQHLGASAHAIPLTGMPFPPSLPSEGSRPASVGISSSRFSFAPGAGSPSFKLS